LRAIPHYLIIGHVTQDVLPDGSLRAGGTATYSALAAEHLGEHVGVLTSADPALPLFANTPTIDVVCRPSAHTTTFENVYTDGHRRQYVRGVADSLTPMDIPNGWEKAPIVHLGPIAHEVDASLAEAFPGALLGVTPQGFLRKWDAHGLVSPRTWEDAERVLTAADVVVLSPEDVGGDRETLAQFRRLARLLVVTIGKDGAIIYHRGQETRVQAYEVEEVDPTGAGDVFATAYLVRMLETRDVIEAARFANCVASFVVEAVGTANIPTREQADWRMRHGRLRG
jgi:1D-myo-inositol 3-kinase